MIKGFAAGVLTIAVVAASASAALPVTSFEADTVGLPPGPPVSSIVGNVTVETGAGFTGDPIAATDGLNFLYMTTGPGPTFGSSGVDRTGAFGAENDIALATVDFVAPAGSLSVSFDWDLLTEEITGGIPDPFEIKLDGVTLVKGAVGAVNGSFPAVVAFTGVAIGGPDGSSFFDGRLGWSSLGAPVAAGPHTLEFFVGDDSDTIVDTALLIDNIEVEVIPVPAALPAGLGLLAVMGGVRALRRRNAV
jgi:hypothetical protein